MWLEGDAVQAEPDALDRIAHALRDRCELCFRIEPGPADARLSRIREEAAASTAGVAVDTLKRWRTSVLTSETAADARMRLAQAYDAFAFGAAA